jgi:hypothetical protein
MFLRCYYSKWLRTSRKATLYVLCFADLDNDDDQDVYLVM